MKERSGNSPLFLAAYNNAVWCDTVCRSHGLAGEFYPTFWLHRQEAPPFYPNMITLSPAMLSPLDQQVLRELLTRESGYPLSVKDSFAVLDLAPSGFRQLFQAQWIWCQAPAHLSHHGTPDLEWRQITTESELLQWEEAWSQNASLPGRLFLPALLHDDDISLIAAYREGWPIAGGIANRTKRVIGLSNVFTPEKEAERCWQGLLSLLASRYPASPVVGYEQDDSLACALHVGFTALGPLRVWLK